MFKKSNHELRHNILGLLVGKLENYKGQRNIGIKNISMTIEEIAKQTNSPIEKIRPQLEILANRNHIHGSHPNNQYAIIKDGGVAYYQNTHIEEYRDLWFKKYDRFFKYIALPLGLIIMISSIVGTCSTKKNISTILEIEETLQKIEQKLETQPKQIEGQNHSLENKKNVQKRGSISKEIFRINQ